jgi:NAD(P)-dependent dehydrogenase (short-subunit alcohol dehydrogenase family)
MTNKKTAIVTGASGAIGTGLVQAFLNESSNVVATSLHTGESLTASTSLVLVDGDITKQETAARVAEAAIQRKRQTKYTIDGTLCAQDRAENIHGRSLTTGSPGQSRQDGCKPLHLDANVRREHNAGLWVLPCRSFGGGAL